MSVKKPDPLPTFSVDLIARLEEMYPEKCPALSTPDREIWYYAGARSVVRMLIAWKKSAEQNSLS